MNNEKTNTMQRAILFLLFTFSFSLFTVHAQKQEKTLTDSLLAELPKLKENTTKADALNSLSWQYYTKGSRDTAFSYAQQALKLSEKLHFKKGTATAFRYLGNHYADLKDSAKALAYYQRALAICKETRDKRNMVSNLRNIGRLYADFPSFPLAMEHYQQALQTAKETNDLTLIITVYKDLGWLAKSFSNYPLALESYQQALRISEKSGNKQTAASLLSDLGWLYRDLEEDNKALDFLNRALENYVELGDQQGASIVLSMTGNIYMGIEEYEKSLEYYNRSSEIAKELNDEIRLANNYANVAFLYQLLKDYATAVKYHKSSFSIFDKFQNKYGELLYYKDMGNLIMVAPDSILLSIDINPAQRYQTAIHYEKRAFKLAEEFNDPIQKGGASYFLTLAYEKSGDFKSAYYNLQYNNALGDSIQGQSVREEIIRKEVQYDYEKKADAAKAEQEKRDIRQQNIRNSLIAGLSVFFLFSVIIYKQRNKVKKEKKRSDNLLLNILPVEVADELKEKGKATAKQYNNVSILFTDFVNFTQTSETLAPQELVEELNECFTAFDTIIERNGLEKIKTIGDAYLAICGLPNEHEHHAQNTVQVALEIRNFIASRKQQLGNRAFDIRIGIHSGNVVAGIVGLKKFAYDIWGDTVNTAARMEQNGEAGKVNISETTYQLVKDDFECAYRGEIEAKGKGKMKMYFVK